jgi:hypothetical protein
MHQRSRVFCSLATALLVATGSGIVMAAAAEKPKVEPNTNTTVGRAARIDDLVLPSPQLEVKPQTDPDAPFVVRMIDVAPHGMSFRYNLEYYALEPGEYNVMDYLQQAGTQAPTALPPHTVSIGEYLPRDTHTHPHPPAAGEVPFLGGYRLWMVAGAVAWFAVAVAIVLVGRQRTENRKAQQAVPRTLADRLRPAIEAAMAGKLDERQLAELERVMLAFWRERLELDDVPAAEALRRMRAHPQGGQLLEQLERWLHQPGQREQVDAAVLLAPYKQMPADALRTSREHEELVPA